MLSYQPKLRAEVDNNYQDLDYSEYHEKPNLLISEEERLEIFYDLPAEQNDIKIITVLHALILLPV